MDFFGIALLVVGLLLGALTLWAHWLKKWRKKQDEKKQERQEEPDPLRGVDALIRPGVQRIIDSMEKTPHFWVRKENPDGGFYYTHVRINVHVVPLLTHDIGFASRVFINGAHTFQCNFAETRKIMEVYDRMIVQPVLEALIEQADTDNGDPFN